MYLSFRSERGAILPKETYSDLTWAEMSNNTPFKKWAIDKEAILSTSAKGDLVISINKTLNPHGWEVWKKSKQIQQPTSHKAFLEKDDKVLISCRYDIVDSQSRNKSFSCARKLIAKDYFLQYDFTPQDKVPDLEYIQLLDQEIIKAIDSWRCEK